MAPPVAACHKQMSSIPTRKGEGKRSLTFAHCFRSGVEIIRITSLREGARLPFTTFQFGSTSVARSKDRPTQSWTRRVTANHGMAVRIDIRTQWDVRAFRSLIQRVPKDRSIRTVDDLIV